MEVVGLEPAPSTLVGPPRVKQSPCAVECKCLQTIRLTDTEGTPAPRFIAFGQVIGIHIDDRFIKNGLLDAADYTAGYQEYFVTREDARFFIDFTPGDRARGCPIETDE